MRKKIIVRGATLVLSSLGAFIGFVLLVIGLVQGNSSVTWTGAGLIIGAAVATVAVLLLIGRSGATIAKKFASEVKIQHRSPRVINPEGLLRTPNSDPAKPHHADEPGADL